MFMSFHVSFHLISPFWRMTYIEFWHLIITPSNSTYLEDLINKHVHICLFVLFYLLREKGFSNGQKPIFLWKKLFYPTSKLIFLWRIHFIQPHIYIAYFSMKKSDTLKQSFTSPKYNSLHIWDSSLESLARTSCTKNNEVWTTFSYIIYFTPYSLQSKSPTCTLQ